MKININEFLKQLEDNTENLYSDTIYSINTEWYGRACRYIVLVKRKDGTEYEIQIKET